MTPRRGSLLTTLSLIRPALEAVLELAEPLEKALKKKNPRKRSPSPTPLDEPLKKAKLDDAVVEIGEDDEDGTILLD
jgi:hypothetical protein